MKLFRKNFTTPILILSLCTVILALSTMLGFATNNKTAYADSSSQNSSFNDAYVEDENIEQFYNVMNIIEEEMKNNNTSVVEQLQKQKVMMHLRKEGTAPTMIYITQYTNLALKRACQIVEP